MSEKDKSIISREKSDSRYLKNMGDWLSKLMDRECENINKYYNDEITNSLNSNSLINKQNQSSYNASVNTTNTAHAFDTTQARYSINSINSSNKISGVSINANQIISNQFNGNYQIITNGERIDLHNSMYPVTKEAYDKLKEYEKMLDDIEKDEVIAEEWKRFLCFIKLRKTEEGNT